MTVRNDDVYGIRDVMKNDVFARRNNSESFRLYCGLQVRRI